MNASTKPSPAPGGREPAGSGFAWPRPGHFALLLGLLLMAAYPEVVFGRSSFFFRDFGFFGYPLAFHHRQSFWSGELPLWNPLNNCGLPFLAQWNTLVLYPGSLFYLLLPLTWALPLFCLLHLWWAGLGMYFLTHHWTGHRLGAAVAGLAFGLNGLALNSLMWPNNAAALGWMPWVVLAAERARTRGGRHLALAAVIGTFQMLSGAPEIILFTWLIVGALALPSLLSPSSGPFRQSGRLLLLVAAIALLAAAQLLPFLQLLQLSQRSEAFAQSNWSMPGTGWANYLIPAFYAYDGRYGISFQIDQHWTSSYYVGILPVTFSCVALAAGGPRTRWIHAGLAAAGILLALGDSSPVYSTLRQLFPQMGVMRYPIKFITITVFAIPVLAAFGTAALCPGSARRGHRAVPIALGVGSLCLAAIGILAWIGGTAEADASARQQLWLNALSRAALLATVGLAIGTLRHAVSRQTATGAAVGLLVVLGIDSLSHMPRQNPTVPRAVLEPGLEAFRDMQPRPALGGPRAMLDPAADHALRHGGLSKPVEDYLASRLGLFSNCNLLEGIPKVNGFYSLFVRESAEIVGWLYRSTNQPPPAGLCSFLSVAQTNSGDNVFAWRSRGGWLPLATLVEQPVIGDRGQVLNGILGESFDPRRQAFFRESDRPLLSQVSRSEGEVALAEVTAHSIRVRSRVDQPSLLVIGQTDYPAWRAYVEGKSVPILRANHAYQAVVLPPGTQNVLLRYEDKRFELGAAVSLLTLMGIILGVRLGRTTGGTGGAEGSLPPR